MGMRQHYLIGSQIRKNYIERHNLISSTYNSSEISIVATDLKRNFESAMAQIAGIFPPTSCLQKLTPWQQRNAVPPLPIDDIEGIKNELDENALPNCFNLVHINSQMKENNYDIQIQDSY